METLHQSPAANVLVLACARLAGLIAADRIPSPRDLFLVAGALVESARGFDAGADDIARDAVAALIENLPADRDWDLCRGYLQAILGLAWLLRGDSPEIDCGPAVRDLTARAGTSAGT